MKKTFRVVSERTAVYEVVWNVTIDTDAVGTADEKEAVWEAFHNGGREFLWDRANDPTRVIDDEVVEITPREEVRHAAE